MCRNVSDQIASELSLDERGRGRNFEFLSDHLLLLADGNQPHQKMVNPDHSLTSDDRKPIVMTTSNLGQDKSTQDSRV